MGPLGSVVESVRKWCERKLNSVTPGVERQPKSANPRLDVPIGIGLIHGSREPNRLVEESVSITWRRGVHPVFASPSPTVGGPMV